MTKNNPFRYFKTSPENIRLAVMLSSDLRFRFEMRNIAAAKWLRWQRVDSRFL